MYIFVCERNMNIKYENIKVIQKVQSSYKRNNCVCFFEEQIKNMKNKETHKQNTE